MDWAVEGLIKRVRVCLEPGVEKDRARAETVNEAAPDSSSVGVWGCLASAVAAVLLAWAAIHLPAASWVLEYYSNPRLEGTATRSLRQLPDFDTSRNDLPLGLPDREDFSVRIYSCLELQVAGDYLFRVKADDGVRLFIDDKLAIDAWRKPNAASEKLVKLRAGVHRLKVEYFNAQGAASLRLEMSDPGFPGLRTLQNRTRPPGSGAQCDVE
jgi:PA14 domain-containing protein